MNSAQGFKVWPDESKLGADTLASGPSIAGIAAVQVVQNNLQPLSQLVWPTSTSEGYQSVFKHLQRLPIVFFNQ